MIQRLDKNTRKNKQDILKSEFVVVGGGLAGVCAAVVAARKGTKVILVQDRPVLGGNASSEVRMWIMGATSHGETITVGHVRVVCSMRFYLIICIGIKKAIR